MAITYVKPSDLSQASSVDSTAAIPVENPVFGVQKAFPSQIVDAGRPVASEAQAIAGTDNETAMTPLTTRQVVDASITASNPPHHRSPFFYGAVGDGVTDDLAAFTAMNAAGGLVYLPKPPVRYLLSAPIDLDNCHVTVDPSAKWDELTDGGELSWTSTLGGWTDSGAPREVNAHRMEKAYFGSAADEWSGNATTGDEGTSWWAVSANASSYLPVNAQNLTIARHTPYGVVSLVRGSDVNGNNGIAFGGSIVNDVPSARGWGGIIEVQREGSSGNTYGWEIGAKDKGVAFTTLNSYNVGSGVFGLWMAGGGSATHGGAATRPANSAMVILKNSASGLSGGGWATGIVFKNDALDGTDGSAGGAGSAVAISMGRRHRIDWGAPETGGVANTNGLFGASIVSRVDDSDNAVQMAIGDNEVSFLERSGDAFFQIQNVGGNYISISSSSGAPRVDAVGVDANINLRLTPKGTGHVQFGAHTAIGAETVTGYITIKDAGGTTRKLAVVS